MISYNFFHSENTKLAYSFKCIIQMQERQKIQQKLQLMQQQCISQYLQDKLKQITSREVVRDILQQFFITNSQQFMKNITDSILEVKDQNKALKKQLQTAKNIQSTIQKIHQQYEYQHSREIERLEVKHEEQIQRIKQECCLIKQRQQIANDQRQVLQAKAQEKLREAMNQNQKLRSQLISTKQSFQNFKASCEKIINQLNRQKDKQKNLILQSWKKEKQEYLAKLKQAQNLQIIQENFSALKQQLQNQSESKKYLETSYRYIQLSYVQTKTQLAHLQKMYEQIRNKYQQRQVEYVENQRVLQTLNLSLNYAREQNNYLRDEILSFSSRYEVLQKQKSQLSKQVNKLNNYCESIKRQHNIILQKIQNQSHTDLMEYKQQYESDLMQMSKQLSSLHEQLDKYREISHNKNTELASFKQNNQKLQETVLILNQKLNSQVSNKQMLERQVQYFQTEITNAHNQSRISIQMMKETFQKNWNMKNEELIQQQYKSKLLTEEMTKLNTQINSLKLQINSLQQVIKQKQSKETYYSLLNQQIGLLKKKITLDGPSQIKVTINKGKVSTKLMNRQTKIYYLLGKSMEELKLIKKDNENLRKVVLEYFRTQSFSFQKLICQGFIQAKQQITFQSLKMRQAINTRTPCSKDESFNRTVPQNSKANLNHIKKALSNINLRYQTVQNENKYYTTHLDEFIKKA